MERSLRFFALDKIVLRYRGLAVETKLGAEGGIQALSARAAIVKIYDFS